MLGCVHTNSRAARRGESTGPAMDSVPEKGMDAKEINEETFHKGSEGSFN